MARSLHVAGGFVPAAVAAADAFLAAAAARAAVAAVPVLSAADALPSPFFSFSGIEHQRFAFFATRFMRAIAYSAGCKTYSVATKAVV
jgi:hypothetical protein